MNEIEKIVYFLGLDSKTENEKIYIKDVKGNYNLFSPLDNLHDSLYIAKTLEFSIEFCSGMKEIQIRGKSECGFFGYLLTVEKYNGREYESAMMKAIFRAALSESGKEEN